MLSLLAKKTIVILKGFPWKALDRYLASSGDILSRRAIGGEGS